MFKDRIIGFEWVPASSLIDNEDNVRLHPDEQKTAMQGILEEIGFADAIVVRQVEAGYQILDGHMRKALLGDEKVPVVIVDLNDEEAASFLLTFDPVKALADKNQDRVDSLLERAFAQTGAVREMLNGMVRGETKAAPMPKGGNSTRARVETLSVGKYRVQLTNAESAKLTLIARRYCENTGSYLKFVDWILKRVKENRAAHGLPVGGSEGSGVQPTQD
ncbi:ParB/RepB/Spo0J family partition protein [Pirellulaceae bacterium SH501]